MNKKIRTSAVETLFEAIHSAKIGGMSVLTSLRIWRRSMKFFLCPRDLR